MNEPETRFQKFHQRIRKNPIVSALILLGTIVIALSTFTNAARNLLDLVITESRPEINGEWQAVVVYDWPNSRYSEIFSFNGDGDEVFGIASFLGTKRGIVEGSATRDKLLFVTKTRETLDNPGNPKEVTHRYRGKVLGDEIRFVMQTEGGSSVHTPVEFTGRRVSAASPEPKS